MKKIGIVSNNKYKNKIIEDIILKEELSQLGLDVEIISWEDKTISFKKFNCLIIRSVWGYHNNFNEFTKWLKFIESSKIKIINSSKLIEKTIKKDTQYYLLKENNISVIDSYFIYSKEDFTKDFLNFLNNLIEEYNSIVIKPIISASGDDTYIIELTQDNLNKLEKIVCNLLKKRENGLVIQPYLKEIERGEFSTIYIDGDNTHTMLRFPGVLTTKKQVEEVQIGFATKRYLNQIVNIKALKDNVFIRIDYVYVKDRIVIMELELIDPDLLTRNLTSLTRQRQILKKLAFKITKLLNDKLL